MDALYMKDSYARECSSTVLSVRDDVLVVLDRSVFYPTGGGQPSDTGLLRSGTQEYHVLSVFKRDGLVFHQVDRPGLVAGQVVVAFIDWPRRYVLMRSHTASHVLSAVMHDVYGAKITGNQLSLEKIRLDFDLEHFDRGVLDEALRRANEALRQDLPVTLSYLPRQEALSKPGFVKLAGALPPAVESLRIVTIGSSDHPFDQQADGGTHVAHTGEVGTLVLLKAENKGAVNRRVYVTLKEP